MHLNKDPYILCYHLGGNKFSWQQWWKNLFNFSWIQIFLETEFLLVLVRWISVSTFLVLFEMVGPQSFFREKKLHNLHMDGWFVRQVFLGGKETRDARQRKTPNHFLLFSIHFSVLRAIFDGPPKWPLGTSSNAASARDWKKRMKRTTLYKIGRAKPLELGYFSTATTVVKIFRDNCPNQLFTSLNKNVSYFW